MTELITLTGGCLCGTVRYEAHGAPGLSAICHCRMCQRASGSPFMALIFLPSADIKLTKGELQIYRSSPTANRHFCGRCGAPIIFERPARLLSAIAVGSLDDPNIFKPQMHVCVESAMTWLDIRDNAPRHAQKPDGMTPLVDYDPIGGSERLFHNSCRPCENS
jgi:hypothetical protein